MRRILATVASVGLILGAGAVTAESKAPRSYPITAADRAAMKQANKQCTTIMDDWQWEACVIGAFTLERGRTLTYHDYETGSRVKLVAGSRPIGR